MPGKMFELKRYVVTKDLRKIRNEKHGFDRTCIMDGRDRCEE
jgi:hypothetical protein